MTEPLLEVNPPACIFVVGPQIASSDAPNAPAASPGPSLGYAGAVRAAMAAALEVAERPFQQTPAAAGREEDELVESGLAARLREAHEREPSLAARHAIDVLKRRGAYERWLRQTFGGRDDTTATAAATASSERQRFCGSAHPQKKKSLGPDSCARGPRVSSRTPALRLLLQLQQRGALLVYTQCDTALDDAAGTAPVLATDGAKFQEWAAGETPGFLHVNGVYTKPDSVLLDVTDYEQSLAKSTLVSLKKIFRQRLAVFVGFGERERADALLLQKMLQAFYSDEASGSVRNPPILLTTGAFSQTGKAGQVGLGSGDGFLRLSVSGEEMKSLDTLITAGLEKNFAIGMHLTV